MNRATTMALGLLVAALPACRGDATGSMQTTMDPTDGGLPPGSTGMETSAQTSEGSGPEPEDTDTDDAPDPGVVYLDPVERLNRASMALRGIRPSLQELQAVSDDPAQLEEIVQTYLDTPEFGATMRDLHNDALLVLADTFYYPAGWPNLPPLEDADVYRMNRSVTEAPLRLAEHVIMNDRPYTELVTADYTVADEFVAGLWGMNYEGDGDTWVQTRWPDGRPHAGILSDSWLYQRHGSTPSNANRGRANAISRALLCYDFLDRDIEIDASINLADPDQVGEAVVANPACAACHQALDPLAGFFGDFVGLLVPSDLPGAGVTSYPFGTWYPNFFATQYGVTLRDPTFFGIAGDSLVDLGTYIAADPRFSACTARRFYAYFHQVPLEEVPLEDAAAFQAEFIAEGFSAKALARAIVLSDDFHVSHVEEGSDATGGVKKARPHQLSALVRDTTGFTWTTRIIGEADGFDTGTVDLMADAFLGYQVLAGGLDSVYVNKPSYTYSATNALVLEQLAEEAAGFVVDADFDQPSAQRRLLTVIEETDVDDAAVRAQLAVLHQRIYGELVTNEEARLDATHDLFATALETAGDARRAWKTTIAAMLQDMAVAYY